MNDHDQRGATSDLGGPAACLRFARIIGGRSVAEAISDYFVAHPEVRRVTVTPRFGGCTLAPFEIGPNSSDTIANMALGWSTVRQGFSVIVEFSSADLKTATIECGRLWTRIRLEGEERLIHGEKERLLRIIGFPRRIAKVAGLLVGGFVMVTELAAGLRWLGF